jgi:hypothetical protein
MTLAGICHAVKVAAVSVNIIVFKGKKLLFVSRSTTSNETNSLEASLKNIGSVISRSLGLCQSWLSVNR